MQRRQRARWSVPGPRCTPHTCTYIFVPTSTRHLSLSVRLSSTTLVRLSVCHKLPCAAEAERACPCPICTGPFRVCPRRPRPARAVMAQQSWKLLGLALLHGSHGPVQHRLNAPWHSKPRFLRFPRFFHFLRASRIAVSKDFRLLRVAELLGRATHGSGIFVKTEGVDHFTVGHVHVVGSHRHLSLLLALRHLLPQRSFSWHRERAECNRPCANRRRPSMQILAVQIQPAVGP